MNEKERKEITIAWIMGVINEGDIFAYYERIGKEDISFEINLMILQETIKLDLIEDNDWGDIIRLEDSYGNKVEFEVGEVDDPANYFDFKRNFYERFTDLMKKTVEIVIYDFKR